VIVVPAFAADGIADGKLTYRGFAVEISAVQNALNFAAMADGMVEDIITALSRFKELFVIARNSSFIYKGKAIDIQQVARDLGVRYVLEGSVRKAGNRVRITGQLIDAATRAHLWADKFDGSFDDVFELQDGITESVVGALAPSLHKAEIERARRKSPSRSSCL
jgi:adenylate cyclase